MGSVLVIGNTLSARAAAIRLAGKGRVVRVDAGAGTRDTSSESLAIHHPRRPGERPFLFHLGPAAITLPFVFQDLFAAAGEDVRDHLEIVPINPIARSLWPGQAPLDLRAQDDEDIPCDRAGWRAILRIGHRYWRHADELRLLERLAQRRPSLSARLTRLLDLYRIGGFHHYARAIDLHITDPRLREVFEHFVNGAPRDLRATLLMFFYAQLHFGAFHVVGGMQRLGEVLDAVAHRLGVEAIPEAAARIRISDRESRVLGVELAGGGFVECRAIVVDSPGTARRLLMGQSAGGVDTQPILSLLLGIEGAIPQLAHQTSLMEDEPIRITAASRTDPSVAPDGCETLVARMRMDSGDPPGSTATVSLRRDRLIQALEAYCGAKDLRSRIVVERAIVHSSNPRPIDIASLARRDDRIRGLYLLEDAPCPGAELALEAIAGKIASEMVCGDLRLNEASSSRDGVAEATPPAGVR